MSDASRARQLLEQLAAERQKGTNIRRGVTYAVLGMFALAVGNAYFKVKNFDVETFVAELDRQTSATVWPLVQREMDGIARDAAPALSAALAAEASALAPKLSDKIAVEAIAFSEHLHARMKLSLDTAFVAAAKQDMDKLKARFPQFADDQTRYDELVARLNVAAQLWAQGQLDTTFKEHMDVLQSINEQVTALGKVSAEDREKNGDPEAAQVMELFLEIMNARLEGGGK
ncbi:MAG: hypothetical protein EXR71_12085 [Myxococcales bacterium]|nr:hypothetical protein [Myxococcales bacterium]